MQLVFSIVTGIVGGVALFLFGMDVLSHSLTMLAGGQFEDFMSRFTDNKIKGWLLGTLVTAIVQSSSATIVLTVGLVNSGIIQLARAASVVIGANLGTTATAWVLSLNSIEGTSFILSLFKPTTFVPYVAIVGTFLILFSKTDKKKHIGSILIGFATMMIGMRLMSDAITPLKESDSFKGILTTFSNPLISFLFAVIFTMLIQSSDAVVGMLQALAIAVSIDIRIAIPIICGAQIGTCITAIISSLGSERNGKRTALIQLYYNLIKNVPFIIIFYFFSLSAYSKVLDHEINAIGIAAFHSAINIVFSIIMLPLSGLLVSLSIKTIPYDEKEIKKQNYKLSMLDPLLLENPAIAITQTGRAVRRISENIQDEYDDYMSRDYEAIDEKADSTLSYIKQTQKYCADIARKSLSEKDMDRLNAIQRICLDYHAINETIQELTTYMQKMNEENLTFSDITQKDMTVLEEATREILSMLMCGLMTGSSRASRIVFSYREVIEDMRSNISMRFIRCLDNDEKDQSRNIYFTDICYSYEKIITRCCSIAEVLVRFAKKGKRKDKDSSNSTSPEVLKELFKDKYTLLNI